MDIVGGIAAAKGAIDIAAALRRAEKNLDVATYKSQLSDLMEKLTDARLALVDAKEALADSDVEIDRLKRAFRERASLIKGDGDYSYLTNDDGERTGLPICPKCEALHNRHIQLKQCVKLDVAKCPACDSEFCPVTCYVSPSENGGIETTTVVQYREAERQRQVEQNAKMARINSKSWMGY
jgi:hypothetical protein